MRARLHVQDGRFGFFREHSHVLCDAAPTGQLRTESLAAVGDLVSRLGPDLARCQAVIVSENLAGSQRILHLESSDAKPVEGSHLRGHMPAGVTGLATWVDGSVQVLAGDDRVTDSALDLFPDPAARPVPAVTRWSRSGAAFFQGNRYLIGPLTGRVLEHARGTVADLYAGVGLFAVGLSARGHRVLAIESDRVSASDLTFNATGQPDLEVHRGAVEHTVRRLRPGAFDTVILDPPRSGLSRDAMAGILTLDAPRIVFVSCDIATFARDAGRLVAQGYRMHGLEAFDMFPNTGHVETLAVFDRGVRS
jgi:tRNA/tmRNA/rRNA uracil-C5-methylase (TrmA/RlmC/RlmD family)